MYSNLSGIQSAAARAMLRIGLQEVENKTGIKMNSVSRFESGKGNLNEDNAATLQKYYEEQGLEFGEFNSVREKPFGSFRELSGFDGFQEFINDVYYTTKENPEKDVVVSNVNEKLFTKWFGVHKSEYLNRMAALNSQTPFSFKILIENGDDYFLASDYAEYRWLDKIHFGSVPFYIYGEKTALILFKDNDVNIYIIHNSDVSETFRKSFAALWKTACIPK